jgi:hypothetical protein
MRYLRIGALLSIILSTGSVGSIAEAEQFADNVAPILRQRCVTCHNPTKARGGLDLTTGEGLQKGGEKGPVVVSGNPAKSLLFEVVNGPKPRMPKQGPKLTADEVADLKKWIDEGAKWPKSVTLVDVTKNRAGPDWWSLQPLTLPDIAVVKDKAWTKNPIDAFILATLEAKGLKPSTAADRRTLIRRVTYDLHGLPPTPDEVTTFVNDASPDAYEKVIDRLLASPRYGERWGRHWLDVVHYGDTHGYDKDKRRDNAWRYRDYVIRSLNNDRPYARFIKEQLAGDVLHLYDPEGIIATGFIAAGPWDFVGHVELREGTVDKEKTRLLDRDDMVSTTVGTFLSLTAHCARCHDHKFDPIPQKDYYSLQAVFAGVDRGDRSCASKDNLVKRENLAKRRCELIVEHARLDVLLDPTARAALANRTKELGAVTAEIKALASAEAVYAVTPLPPRPIYVLHRGEVEQRRDLVVPGALSCIKGLEPEFKLTNPQEEGGRRLALAEWIADNNNPLTWRSIVNRVWHYHFGRGLVDTPNDFGWNGSRPTHPELLDWLAVTFRDQGGALKKLHRLILLSAVYQQTSAHDAQAAKIDVDNRYLWRMNRSRLDSEEIRDAVLAVSGKLDLKMGGPGFELFRFKDDHSPIYDHSDLAKINDPATFRRTVYRFVVRSVPNPFIECMDGADPNLVTPVRTTTVTALQALALLNDPFMIKQGEFLAERLTKISDDPAKQIEAAYQLLFSRQPTESEREVLVEYTRAHGLASACRLLFNANEFVFVD